MTTIAIVPEFAFMVQGRTRDECIQLADQLGRQFMDSIGGEPWQMIDDDWHRLHVSQYGSNLTLADDQGYFYQGKRRYQFGGPFLGSVDTPTRDGYNMQRAIRESSD